MNDRIDWPKLALIVGVVAFAINSPQAAPQLVAAGGLTPEQWGAWVGPLLLAIPKFVDLWKSNRKSAVGFVAVISALEVVKRYCSANGLGVDGQIDEVAGAIVSTLGRDDQPQAKGA